MTTEQDIAQFVETQIKNYPGITGARLGALAAAQFPGVNFRIQFNGLKNFVKKYCPPEIEVTVGGSGGDDAYRWTTAPAADQEGATVVATADAAETPWSAFASSDSSGRLRLNRESGEMEVVSGLAGSITAPWIEIPKVTTDEYRQMGSSFLSQIADVDRHHFSALLGEREFWDRWFAETRSFGAGKYLRPWLAFRFQKLCEIFIARLREAGIDQQFALGCLERLKQSKTSRKGARLGSSLDSFGPNSSMLRRIAIAAVKVMSDDDLRRIWLPLGVVSDALRSSDNQ